METTTLPISTIRTDGGTQARDALNNETVTEYGLALIGGAVFPPVVVFYDGAEYWLADGFHRRAAFERTNQRDILAHVEQGTRRDAMLYAVGANANHGLRRTNADKQRAIDTLLRDEEWRTWSDSEIARRVGVDHKTVGGRRRALESTWEIPRSDERKTADGRTMDTTNLGPVKPAVAQPSIPPVVRMVPLAAATGHEEEDEDSHEEPAEIAAATAPTPRPLLTLIPLPATPAPAGNDTGALVAAVAVCELARQMLHQAEAREDAMLREFVARGRTVNPRVDAGSFQTAAAIFLDNPAFRAQVGFLALGVLVDVQNNAA